jgi:diguanylate cyclase (GGDEF)-like protein
VDAEEVLRRRLERERKARLEAERIIEQKSRALYDKGLELERAAADERRARHEAEALRDALVAFSSQLDAKQIAARLVEYLRELVPHEASAVHISGRGAGGARPVSPFGAHDGVQQDAGGVSGKARLSAPLAVLDREIAAVDLWRAADDPFSADEERLTRSLGAEAAVALENARLFAEVERLSTEDPLTGLRNRRYFERAAAVEFQRARRHGRPLSAVMLDIDHFKAVNDAHGHAAGDDVLVAVAAACLSGIRGHDVHARYGGDEFCFLLPDTDLAQAAALAERLREAVSALSLSPGGRPLRVTASLGVAEAGGNDESVAALLGRADEGLYEAKRRGRDRVVTGPDTSVRPGR